MWPYLAVRPISVHSSGEAEEHRNVESKKMMLRFLVELNGFCSESEFTYKLPKRQVDFKIASKGGTTAHSNLETQLLSET